MPMPQKPSLRNIIASAQDYLTFVETCGPYAQQPIVAKNADEIRANIESYNLGVEGGLGRGMAQAKFEDDQAKKMMASLGVARLEIQKATTHPEMKNFVADGGGSEWNRQNPLKLYNGLRDLGRAELEGVGRAASTYHSDGSIKYEAHGHSSRFKVADPVTKLHSDYKPKTPVTGGMKR